MIVRAVAVAYSLLVLTGCGARAVDDAPVDGGTTIGDASKSPTMTTTTTARPARTAERARRARVRAGRRGARTKRRYKTTPRAARRCRRCAPRWRCGAALTRNIRTASRASAPRDNGSASRRNSTATAAQRMARVEQATRPAFPVRDHVVATCCWSARTESIDVRLSKTRSTAATQDPSFVPNGET